MHQQHAGVLAAQKPAGGPPAPQPATPAQQPANASSESENAEPDNNSQTSHLPSTGPGEEKRESPEEQEQDGVEDNRRNIPKINCPEKIVLCFDLSCELNSVLLRQNQEKSVFDMVKRSMEFFVKHKLGMNKKHKIAILTLDKNALWVQDFSSDVNFINDTLDNIRTNTTDPLQQFDMTSLFETIENHVEVPKTENVDIPPKHIVRLIMIYGRSHSHLPSFSGEGKRIFENYMSCPFFFFDVLYVHELPDEDNNCVKIYDAFCKLDETEDWFVLEVSHSAARLFEHTAKLLAHPLQRPRQQDIDYRVVKNDGSDEEPEPE